MSLLVTIRREDRIVNGALVKVGASCRLPNALARVLERTGLCAWADGKAQIKDAEARREKCKSAKALRGQKKGDKR
jgi:hypothetical protein